MPILSPRKRIAQIVAGAGLPDTEIREIEGYSTVASWCGSDGSGVDIAIDQLGVASGSFVVGSLGGFGGILEMEDDTEAAQWLRAMFIHIGGKERLVCPF